ncbi:MAG: glycosyltransferase family 39 protein [Proteobacteria bacterium]|nr:glycosyltransferase family 39 protein [Pseudomonadota bacterium]
MPIVGTITTSTTMNLLHAIARGQPLSASTTRALILLLAITIMLPLLGFVEIYNVGEGREGSVVQEVLKSGELVLPLRNGEIVPSKPMMFHWLATITALVTGDVDNFEIRLPSALAGVGSVWILFWLLQATLGTGAAAVGALILLTTEGFVAVSTEGRVDSVFSFFIVASIAVALRGILLVDTLADKRIPSRYIILSALACGCAVLTKGPVGWVLVGMVVSGLLLLLAGPRGLWQLLRPELLLAVALPAPWYLAATLKGGEDFIARQFFYENLRRFTGGAGITGKPLWYYPNRMLTFCIPWGFLVPLALFAQWHRRTINLADPAHRLARLIFWGGAVWFFLPMVFLSLASGKHPAYLMPLLPGLALMLTTWIYPHMSGLRTPSWVDSVAVGITWIILCIGPAFLVLLPFIGRYLHGHADLMARHFHAALAPRAGTVLLMFCLFAGISWWLVLTRRQRGGALWRWGPVLISVLLLILGVYVKVGRAVKGWIHGDRPLAQQILANVSERETIHWVLPRGTDEKLGVGRDDSFDTVFFHLNRHVVRLDTKGQWDAPGLYVARRAWVEKQSEAWRARMRIRLEGGKIDDAPGERVFVFDLLPPQPNSQVDTEE